MRIPDWPVAGDREIDLLREVLASPQWGGFHPLVADFELKFAQYQHCEHGIAVANGTVSLEMAFAVEGLGPGDEVIVPAISFVSTATALSRVGATPVFVDIEACSFNMDPARVEEAISPRTKGIVAVHFGGPLANIDALLDIAKRHDIRRPRPGLRMARETGRQLRPLGILQLPERQSVDGRRRRRSRHQ
jgi:dTDP-4-amino-4,6-dideoxygalactose transaminase